MPAPRESFPSPSGRSPRGARRTSAFRASRCVLLLTAVVLVATASLCFGDEDRVGFELCGGAASVSVERVSGLAATTPLRVADGSSVRPTSLDFPDPPPRAARLS